MSASSGFETSTSFYARMLDQNKRCGRSCQPPKTLGMFFLLLWKSGISFVHFHRFFGRPGLLYFSPLKPSHHRLAISKESLARPASEVGIPQKGSQQPPQIITGAEDPKRILKVYYMRFGYVSSGMMQTASDGIPVLSWQNKMTRIFLMTRINLMTGIILVAGFT